MARHQRPPRRTASQPSEVTRITRCTQSIADATLPFGHSSATLSANGQKHNHSSSSGTSTTSSATSSPRSTRPTMRPRGNATSSAANSPSQRSPTQIPAVNTTDACDDLRIDALAHSSPISTINGPTRLPGRCAMPSVPLARNDQPTSNCSSGLTSALAVIQVEPTPAASPAATSARRDQAGWRQRRARLNR